MATAAAKATRRRVLEHAERTATGANTALAVAAQIGIEWRLFQNLSLPRRLWWLLTGRICPSASSRRRFRSVAVVDGPADTLNEEIATP